MHLAYTEQTIRQVEEPYVSAPNYDGWLMQKAAAGLADIAQKNLKSRSLTLPQILILVGAGNNGADVLYAAQALLDTNPAPTIYAVPTAEKMQPKALAAFTASGGKIRSLPELASLALESDLIIDGIVGTGGQGQLKGQALTAVKTLNQAKKDPEFRAEILACDIPSGLSGLSGKPEHAVLAANETATFIARKPAMLTPAEYLCGKVHVIELGIEEDLAEYPVAVSRLNRQELRQVIPQPGPYDYKYSRGILGTLVGSQQYPGAALMSIQSAVNTGVGMVKAYAQESLAYQINMTVPEAVCFEQELASQRVDAWAAGSGVVEQEASLEEIVTNSAPAVLDAGALDTVARTVALKGTIGAHKILTPHAGELASMFLWLDALASQPWKKLGHELVPPPEDISQDPLYWVKIAAWLTGATVLLKGATTLIASPCGEVYSVRAKTSWLATAGSGDTLTGILGGLLATVSAGCRQQNIALEGADYAKIAALAATIHSDAAAMVHAGRQGPTPPSRVAALIPEAISELLERQ